MNMVELQSIKHYLHASLYLPELYIKMLVMVSWTNKLIIITSYYNSLLLELTW